MKLKFSAGPCYRDPNNKKYFAIQLMVDECELKDDRDIARQLKMVTKSYRNILRRFNAKMKFEKDTNIVFDTIEELNKAVEYLECIYQNIYSIEFTTLEELMQNANRTLKDLLSKNYLQQTKEIKEIFTEDNIYTQMFGSFLQQSGESIDDFRKILEKDHEEVKKFINTLNENESVKFKKCDTDEGNYIYGECTNEFVESHKDLVPIITFEELIERSMNKIKTDWNTVCKFYMLNEEFMDDLAPKMNWILVSKYQNISLDFIKRHKSELDLDMISVNVKVSQEVKDEVLKMIPPKKASYQKPNSMDLGNGMILEGLEGCTVMSGDDFEKHVLPHLDELCAGHSHEDDKNYDEDEDEEDYEDDE